MQGLLEVERVNIRFLRQQLLRCILQQRQFYLTALLSLQILGVEILAGV